MPAREAEDRPEDLLTEETMERIRRAEDDHFLHGVHEGQRRFISEGWVEEKEVKARGATRREREGTYVEIPTDELPRRVPQDPESVRNEQEVRRAAAKLKPTAEVDVVVNAEEAKQQLRALKEALDELREDVRRLRLEDGDGIVIEFPQRVSADAFGRIKAQIAAVYPGHPVLILEGGAKISTIQRDKIEAVEPLADGWPR